MNTLKRNTTLLATLVYMAIGTVASAQTSATPSPANASAGAPSDSKLASKDEKFIEKAAQGGEAEVELGNLAQQRGMSEQVKQFGARMVQDHTKANDQLKQIAMTKGVALPTGLDASSQKIMDKLQKLSGADFDKAYIKDMVSDHKDDISDFKKEAKSGKDAELKNFASTTLPTLQEHLQMAQSAKKAL